MQMTRKLVLGAVFAMSTLVASLAQANIVVSHGTGKAPYTGHDSKGGMIMRADDEQAAIAKAEINAIDMYFAKQSDAATGNYEAIRDSIASSLDRYVLNYDILNEQKTESSVTVIVKTTLNGSLLNNALNKASKTSAISTEKRSSILSVFVARQIDSIKTFDAHVYKRADASAKANSQSNSNDNISEKTRHSGSQGESISGGHIAVNDSKITQMEGNQRVKVGSNVNSTATVETGGSVTQKSSQSTWRMYPSDPLNISITSVLSQKGYQIVPEEQAEANSNGVISIQIIRKDYSTGDDLSPKNKLSIERAAMSMGIKYVIFGTADLGQTETSPESGNPRVGVTVNAIMYDLSGRFATQKIVVGPTQYFGESSNEKGAQTQALKNAGEAAAKEVANQMQELGLH